MIDWPLFVLASFVTSVLTTTLLAIEWLDLRRQAAARTTARPAKPRRTWSVGRRSAHRGVRTPA